MPFYAVRLGRKPGIYNSWSECHEQVVNFKDAKYRKFDTKNEAQLFICGFDNPGGSCTTPTKSTPTPTKAPPTSTPTRSVPYKMATPTASSATSTLSSRPPATCTETSPNHSIEYQLKLTDEEISLLREKLTFLQNKKQLLLTEKAFEERKVKLAKEESQLKLKEHHLREKKETPGLSNPCNKNTCANWSQNKITTPLQNTEMKKIHTSATQNAANQQQSTLDNAEKCRNFLSTVIKLTATKPGATVSRVRYLIQSLIDDKLKPELFTEQLQLQVKSSSQPYLAPFLKKTLPLLRQALLSNKMSIDGVRPPPPEVVQKQLISSNQPAGTHHTLGVPKTAGVKNQSSKPTSTHQMVSGPNKPSHTEQMNIGAGNRPSTVKASRSQVAGLASSPGAGPSHSGHKRKRRY